MGRDEVVLARRHRSGCLQGLCIIGDANRLDVRELTDFVLIESGEEMRTQRGNRHPGDVVPAQRSYRRRREARGWLNWDDLMRDSVK
jgi:hypothetical protein